MCPYLESGHAFLISEFFTFDHAVNWQLEKQTTVPFCALSGQTRAFQFQLAGPLAKKFSKVVAPRNTKVLFAKEARPAESPQTRSGTLGIERALR